MHPIIEARHLPRLWGYIWRHKRLLFLTLGCGVVGFLVTFIYPWLIGELVDEVLIPPHSSTADRRESLIVLTVLGLVTPIFFSLAGYGRGHFNMLLGNRIVIDLRRDLFRHLQQLSLRFYSRERTGTIVHRLLHEVHGVCRLLHAGIILVFLDIAQLGIAVLLLWLISPVLTLTVLAVLPCYVLTFILLNPGVRSASERVHQEFSRLAGNLQEQFSGIALTKAYAAEDREEVRLIEDSERHFMTTAHQSRLGHRVGAASEFFIHLGTGAIIGCAGYLALGGPGTITPGELTQFIGYTGILYGPVQRLADLNIVYQNSLASIRRVFRIFDIQPHVAEPPNPYRHSPREGGVTFTDVYFRYDGEHDEARIRLEEDPEEPTGAAPRASADGRSGWILEGISFTAKPGEKIAFVGPSGSGKTTLVSLIPRFYDATAGSVRIDGIDVRDYGLKALRGAIAVVQQESFLFSGTVRDNIAYGKPGASDKQIEAAAKAANAHEFIRRLRYGYDAPLGERGVLLSGGQKQRIAIARALLCDPRILILDEATSSLDAESESLVVEALDRLMAGRTCFIVAHRLSTVRDADRIFTLHDGRIVEDGAHDELLLNNGLYAQLFSKQVSYLAVAPRSEGAR